MSSSAARLLLVTLALGVPFAVDPFGVDTLSVQRLLLGLLGCALLVREAWVCLASGHGLSVPPLHESLLGAFVLWSFVSLSWATNWAAGLAGTAMLLGVLGVTRSVRSCASLQQQTGVWLTRLCVVGAAAAVVDHALSPGVAVEGKSASLLFEHANMAASYGALLIPASVALCLGGRGQQRLWGGVSAVVLGSYVLSLQSLGGVLAAAAGLGVWCALCLWRKPLMALALRRWALAGVCVLLCLLPFSDSARGLAKGSYYRAVAVLQQWEIYRPEQAGFRADVFSGTIRMAKQSPWGGVGSGNWAVEYPRTERYLQDRPHAHNDALQVLAELGAPGLLLFLGIFGALAWSTLLRMRAAATLASYSLPAGMLGSLAAFLVAGLFEVPFTLGSSAAALAVLMGVTSASPASAAQALAKTSVHGRRRQGVRRVVAWVVLLLAGSSCVYILQRAPATRQVARAEALAAANERVAAIEALRPVTRMLTGSWLPEQALGRWQLALGRGEQALVSFLRGRRLSPYKVELKADVGEALSLLGRHAEAAEIMREVVREKPSDEGAISKLVVVLERAGSLEEGIELLEYAIQARFRSIRLETILQTARLWRAVSEREQGGRRIEALVAARHFFAVYLEDAPAELCPAVQPVFKHLTHQLQVLPASPASWWSHYEDFLSQGGWSMPAVSLWTSLDEDGVRLMPGWERPAGPPRPREMRNAP